MVPQIKGHEAACGCVWLRVHRAVIPALRRPRHEHRSKSEASLGYITKQCPKNKTEKLNKADLSG